MMTPVKRVFSEGFRAFFLAAGVFAALAVLIWELWLLTEGGFPDLPSGMSPSLWHAHEMVFGYGTAAMGGFLLTATPGWTGARGRPHLFIAVAVALWLAGRLGVWGAGVFSPVTVAAVDLAFLPLMAVRLVIQALRRPKPQILVFLLFVILVWTGNLMMHLQWVGLTDDTLDRGLTAGLFAFCAMISVLGGRVAPGFTRNAMKREGVAETLWPRSPAGVSQAANGLALLLPVAVLLDLADPAIAALAIAAGGAQLIRLALWRGYRIWRQPILWSLHLALLMLALGLVSYGAGLQGIGSEIAALHVLGIGAVGGMTLAIMSRAILSHTGREILAPKSVAIAYALIAFSAALRWLGSEVSAEIDICLVLAAGATWILAFVLFLAALAPAILSARLSRHNP